MKRRFAILLSLAVMQALIVDGRNGQLFAQKAKDPSELQIYTPAGVLIDELKNKDPKIRAQSAYLLASIKIARAVPALMVCLKDPDPDVRGNAAVALGWINDRQCLDGLVDSVNDGNPAVRAKIVNAIGSIGSMTAMPVLSAMLNDKDDNVRVAAIKSIGNLAYISSYHELEMRLEHEKLLDLMKDEKLNMRLFAIERVADYSNAFRNLAIGKDIVRQLVQMLNDGNPKVQAAAADLLIRARDRSSFPALLKLLESGDPDVKNSAMRAIIVFGDASAMGAVPKLSGALIPPGTNGKAPLAEYAESALIRIGGPSVAGAMVPLLANPAPAARASAVRVLGSIGDESQVPRLIEMAEDKDPNVARAAITVLQQRRDSAAVSALIKYFTDTCKDMNCGYYIQESLASMKDPAAISILSKSIRAHNEEFRKSAPGNRKNENESGFGYSSEPRPLSSSINILGKIGGISEIPLLIEAGEDPLYKNDCTEAINAIGTRMQLAQSVAYIAQCAEPSRKLLVSELLPFSSGNFRDPSVLSDMVVLINDTFGDTAKETEKKKGHEEPGTMKFGEPGKPVPVSAGTVAEKILSNCRSTGKSLVVARALMEKGIPEVRSTAAGNIFVNEQMKSLPLLILAARDTDDSVRLRALEYMGNLARYSPSKKEFTDCIPVIINSLKSENPEIRSASASALGYMGDDSLAKLLIPLMSDADPHVRGSAAGSLLVMKEPAAKPAMGKALHDSMPAVRAHAARYFNETADKDIITKIIMLLQEDADYDVRRAAAETLGCVSDDRIPGVVLNELSKMIETNGPENSELIRLAGKLRIREAVPALHAALHGYIQNRSVIIDALGEIGDRSSVPYIVSCKKSYTGLGREIDINLSIAAALGKIKGVGSIEGLADLLRSLGGRDSSYIDKPVVNSLMQLNGASVIYKDFMGPDYFRYFNIIRTYMILDDGKIKETLQSKEPVFRTFGYYLAALQAREKGNYQSQYELCMEALKNSNALGTFRVFFIKLALCLRAQAEIKLGKPEDAVSTIESMDTITYNDEMDRFHLSRNWGRYVDRYDEIIRYWFCRALAACNRKKEARHQLEMLLKDMDELKYDLVNYPQGYDQNREWFLETTEKLIPMVRTDLAVLFDDLKRENLELAVEKGRARQAADSVEMESEETRYMMLIRDRIGQGRDDDAQKLMEEFNLRRMTYMNRHMKVRLADRGSQEYVDQFNVKKGVIDEISRKINDKINQLKGGGQAVNTSDPELASLEKEKLAKQRELNKYVTGLKRAHPDLSALLTAEPIELARLQDRLPADVAILQYLLLPDRIVVFIIRKSGIDIVETMGDRENLAALARRYIEGIRDKKPEKGVNGLGRDLYERLIAPAARSGRLEGVKCLGISPNGILHYVPFAALPCADGTYLSDRYTLFFMNSTSLLSVAADRARGKSAKGGSLFAIGNPDGTLEGAEAEVDEIGKKFTDSRIRKRGEVKKDELRGGVPAAVLHFATHGRLDSRDGTKSYLVMAKSRKAEDQLSVEEIWGLPLSQVGLTVLSACETGVGDVLSGDDVVSLENAFIYAGSPTVVASLWEVDDEATRKLMVAFYGNLAGGMGKAASLSAAQKIVRAMKGCSHPYYWAAFSLRGWWE